MVYTVLLLENTLGTIWNGMYGVLTLPIKKLVEGFLIIVFFFFLNI